MALVIDAAWTQVDIWAEFELQQVNVCYAGVCLGQSISLQYDQYPWWVKNQANWVASGLFFVSR